MRAVAVVVIVAAGLITGCDDDAPDARGDAGPIDAAVDAGTALADPVLYPVDRTHSPITADLAAHLRAIAALGPDQDDHVFAKIGDSITASSSYLRCFAGTGVDLADHAALDATRQHFLAGDAAGTSPFERDSGAAVVGWAARGPITGDPTPLDLELAALAPRYATLMFGTNDVGYRSADLFGSDLWTIVDLLLARGVVPVMSTIPPLDSDATAGARVPLFNLVVRAIAQGRQVPLVDYHRELLPLPDHGLFRDGVHPSTSSLGACVLTTAALTEGYNVRNLLTLEAFDRARTAIEGGPAPDLGAPRRLGTGRHDDPFIAELPFVDLGDTSAGDALLDAYPGCAATQDERGPERVYRLELTERVTLDANLVDRGDTDVDIHILADTLDPAACRARGHQSASATVGPGTIYVVVDTFADHAGEYLLTLEGAPVPAPAW